MYFATLVCPTSMPSLSSSPWMFADPPYNVPVAGHASGLGAVKHADFVMASGELSSAEFQCFLQTALGHAAACSVNGAIHYVCMDWRHQREVLAAGDQIYSNLKNLCVWRKTNFTSRLSTGRSPFGYDYDIDWTPMSAGLAPAGMAASFAALGHQPRSVSTSAVKKSVPANSARWI